MQASSDMLLLHRWDGSASQSDLIAAAQWVLCPTKYDHSAPDCTRGAHVVSCSFGGNASMTWLNPAVKATHAPTPTSNLCLS